MQRSLKVGSPPSGQAAANCKLAKELKAEKASKGHARSVVSLASDAREIGKNFLKMKSLIQKV